MNRYRSRVFAFASLALGLLVVVPARAASLTEVPVATWAGSIKPPSYIKMFIYVPDKVAAKPPLMVSAHSCGSTASGQMSNIPKIKAAADSQGFILILPDNPGQNCWDAGSTSALTHDGGSDTQAMAQMVKYTLSKYNGDAARVYMMGGSSGGIMTQAMMGVYPDIFKAGHARAGAPAGCWSVSYDPSPSQEWSGPCANGTVTKTAQAWGDQVRAMYPGYTGHRPRVQIMQGAADTTIHYVANFAEGIKEWTNVLGLSTEPTSTDKGYKAANASYDRQFWKNSCYTVLEAWSSPGGTHSMPYEEADILKFFGLDTAGALDPEDAACSGSTGDSGVAGTGGGTGTGGTTGAGGAGGASDGGSGGRDGGRDVVVPGSGGVQASGGTSGSGGVQASGGSSASGGAAGTGGRSGSGGTPSSGGASGSGGAATTGGSVGNGGSSAKGGSGGDSSGGTQGNGGSSSQGGNSGTGGSTQPQVGTTNTGCSCSVGSRTQLSASQVAALLLGVLGLVFRRQRRTRR